MGRRKIEIEPITVSIRRALALSCDFTGVKRSLPCLQHERNRSVTFLKVSSYFAILAKKVLAYTYLTFLDYHHHHQRKNGLFKKAYELGVLCSVDIAVIVFGLSCPPRPTLTQVDATVYLYLAEERSGHHAKLYEYCSGNIGEILQRYSRVCMTDLSTGSQHL